MNFGALLLSLLFSGLAASDSTHVTPASPKQQDGRLDRKSTAVLVLDVLIVDRPDTWDRIRQILLSYRGVYKVNVCRDRQVVALEYDRQQIPSPLLLIEHLRSHHIVAVPRQKTQELMSATPRPRRTRNR
ncbi:MAG: hypothetical protein N2561_02680 [Bacteroidetes bacterium]|nr:hypothetical protein [Bacteroidota bacterium]